jgi:AcrR family transcriptional regulator
MAANTDRIVTAAVTLIRTVRRLADITLDDIARQSGVTVRTVLRRFGSRDGVLSAAFDRLKPEFHDLRRPTPLGDVDAALASLMNQYEQIGDFNIRALEAEDQLALVHRGLDYARRSHRAWLAGVFAPNLAGLAPKQREQRVTALYAATDIYLWKLLRRDLKLGPKATEETFSRLVRGVLAGDQ